MEIEFDPKKSARNAEARGLPFELAAEAFEWDAAHIIADDRRDYGEERFLAFAPPAASRRLLLPSPRQAAGHQFPQGEQARGAGL